MFVSDIQALLELKREVFIDSIEELIEHKEIIPMMDTNSLTYGLTIKVKILIKRIKRKELILVNLKIVIRNVYNF